MDGLLVYADIFAGWIENLSAFWGFLQTNIIEILQRIANTGGPADFINTLVQVFIFSNGLQNLTVLGFIFASMGYAFGLYFAITLIKWVLDVLF